MHIYGKDDSDNMLHTNLSIDPATGHLLLAGRDTVELAEKYGTPLYLLDEARIREKCRTYVNAMKEAFAPGSMPLLASKALCFKGIYKIAAEEQMGTDLVSPGELYTARAAGFDLSRAYFHGNNKTDEDIAFALDSGVGYFICDNLEELQSLQAQVQARGQVQKILLRVTPGIDPHTHKAISTGKVDSKFGTAIETGQAIQLVRRILDTMPNLDLQGLHCHVGSLCFDSQPFLDAADIMIAFLAEIRAQTGVTLHVLNLGGGYGVRYVESDPHIDIADNIRQVGQHIRTRCEKEQFPEPQVLLEPGRSIVADAGVTMYTVGSVKTITGYKSYVSIDGGMTDNPRYALYQSAYTVLNASHADRKADLTATIAGRCCESGDLIQEDVALATPVRGDKLAVLVTGAYNYSMASNYNRLPRPAIVMIHPDGTDALAVRRETYEDLIRCDM